MLEEKSTSDKEPSGDPVVDRGKKKKKRREGGDGTSTAKMSEEGRAQAIVEDGTKFPEEGQTKVKRKKRKDRDGNEHAQEPRKKSRNKVVDVAENPSEDSSLTDQAQRCMVQVSLQCHLMY